jgi:hypothetical protein
LRRIQINELDISVSVNCKQPTMTSILAVGPPYWQGKILGLHSFQVETLDGDDVAVPHNGEPLSVTHTPTHDPRHASIWGFPAPPPEGVFDGEAFDAALAFIKKHDPPLITPDP